MKKLLCAILAAALAAAVLGGCTGDGNSSNGIKMTDSYTFEDPADLEFENRYVIYGDENCITVAGAVDRGLGMLAMYSIFYADDNDALLCSYSYWIFDTAESAQAFADQQEAQGTVTTIVGEDTCVLYACPDNAATAEMMSIFDMDAVSDYVAYFADMVKATVQ